MLSSLSITPAMTVEEALTVILTSIATSIGVYFTKNKPVTE